LWQTWFASPHDVPFCTFPVSLQTGNPESQAIVPVLHRLLLGLQAIPVVHDPQVPLLHTLFVPHVIPFVTLPITVHTGKPVPHAYAPILQAPASQVAPAMHAPHTPALHTLSVPHVVPFATFPVSVHICVPDAHEFVPVLHGFVGEQIVPEVHTLHTPPLHTFPVPHEVPFATFPVSAQTIVPLVHVVAPVLHGFVG
jgi:hypothetical protein